ncbi:hypothetical protein RU07_23745 [Agrobacterium tumefaciens]|uniref:Uncharacterized protein n=1 Tax=Agrobacterium tumefaciens TaxID=358 RepID=A0A0D0KHV9_AGRTU|nr:hypothetical protein RU07_23745 [Agrobacterium tumefaciens]
MKVPTFQLQHIDVQISHLSRAGYYAEPVLQSPRFPANAPGKLGIISRTERQDLALSRRYVTLLTIEHFNSIRHLNISRMV